VIAAASAARDRDARRLLVVDSQARVHADQRLRDLADLLQPLDLLVVNDSATLPASLSGVAPNGEPIELRLLGQALPSAGASRWRAVVFGAGDWRTDTLERALPPRLGRGDGLRFGGELTATIEAVSEQSTRLLVVHFDRSGADLWAALYRIGRPVQYAYLDGDLDLSAVQTVYASRPWSVEPPSAGLGLSWSLLDALAARGIDTVRLTHAAGLSSTGDGSLDALLPLPERYDIPAATVSAIETAHHLGGRVIAVGTTVARALEASHREHGQLRAGPGIARMRIGPACRPAVVDGLISGLHEPGASHHDLLQAFADESLLMRAWSHASERGYLAHELGDVCLIAPDVLQLRRRHSARNGPAASVTSRCA
jgi:S-adenosylmethionine:tRNA ribosyltransferase-isomerase